MSLPRRLLQRRLLGIETEYAIRFTPVDGGPRPGNHVVFEAISAAVHELVVATQERPFTEDRGRFFTESSASFAYEHLPSGLDAGLVEGTTPECGSAAEVLTYQKANDLLLARAAQRARESLASRGFHGELALLKNCRDVDGHTYGAQENYEVVVAEDRDLLGYRLALGATTPMLVASSLLGFAALAAAALVAAPVALVAGAVHEQTGKRLDELKDHFAAADAAWRWFGWADPISRRPIRWATRALERFVFKSQRDAALAFIVSRCVFSGAGTLDPDGTFRLSEKGTNRQEVLGVSAPGEPRPVIDVGNLSKDQLSIVSLETTRFARLFGRRQRMQLGLSDSNMAETAELLKLGTTRLVLDLLEAGRLEGAPRLADPIGAVHILSGDASLEARVPLVDGRSLSGLDLQRWYLGAARRWLAENPDSDGEVQQTIATWADVLDTLARDPTELIGVLDWPTKRWLIESCGRDQPFAVRKKIDLKYHELETGYFAQLEREGIAPIHTDPDAVERAQRTPPSTGSARLRGDIVRRHAASDPSLRVSWDHARVGWRRRAIRLRTIH